MTNGILFFFLALCLFGTLNATEIEKSPVRVLTFANFDDAVEAGPLLVEFYAPWCGHCQTFEKSYENVAAQLRPKGIPVAKVDGSSQKLLSMRFGIKGYPSFFFINEGEVFSFKGVRNEANMVKFALEQEGAFKESSKKISHLWQYAGIAYQEFAEIAEVVRAGQLSPVTLAAIALAGMAIMWTVLGGLVNLLTRPPPVRPAAPPGPPKRD